MEIVTPNESIGIVIALVQESMLPRQSQKPLTAVLKATAASFDDGCFIPALNQLVAFQKMVRAMIGRSDRALANELIAAAQLILDSLSPPEP